MVLFLAGVSLAPFPLLRSHGGSGLMSSAGTSNKGRTSTAAAAIKGNEQQTVSVLITLSSPRSL